MDYAKTTNVTRRLYSMVDEFTAIARKLIKWPPGECANWFFDNPMTLSYCSHRRHSMPRQKNTILIDEHALNRETLPLRLQFTLKLFLVVCCYGWQGWTWIETFKNYGHPLKGFMLCLQKWPKLLWLYYLMKFVWYLLLLLHWTGAFCAWVEGAK